MGQVRFGVGSGVTKGGFWGTPPKKMGGLIQQNIKHIIGQDYQLLLLSKFETRQCYLIQQNIKHIIGHVYQLLLLSKTVRVTQFNKI